MVATGLEPEVVDIINLISTDKNFLLSGGAGSGKTYSLVSVIKETIKSNPTKKVACMTYTNAAVKEIEERVNHENLNVTTIHDFLWDNIKSYQKELKKCLITLLNDVDSKVKIADETITDSYFDSLEKGIQYKEWTKIKDGIISHDELLELANLMYKTYPLLCNILKDKYKFVFIDEYQDTNPLVVEIFLTHLKQSKKKNIIGFFGDSMQAIYEDGIGNLNPFLLNGDVVEVKKEQNRRNPELVINLANQLRNDGLIQNPSTDPTAPNMNGGKVKEGKITFIYSDSEDLPKVHAHLGWNFNDAKLTKELNLTHNLIAPKAGFDDLMEIYDNDPIIGLKQDIQNKIKELKRAGKESIEIQPGDSFDKVVDAMALKNRQKQLKKDVIVASRPDLYNEVKDLPYETVKGYYIDKASLIDDKKQEEDDDSKKGSKRDNIVKHLFKIQLNIHLYKEKQYNEFLRKTEFRIRTNKDKKELAEVIEKLDTMHSLTIEEVIEFAHEKSVCIKDDKLEKFIQDQPYLYNRVKQVPYEQFQKLFYYLEGYTPFSTQHKIKGTEFDNVLTILDNGNWPLYNFEYLFNNRTDKASVLERTQKIFYVCCTRAKENLAVYYVNPNANTIRQAEIWFGKQNLVKL